MLFEAIKLGINIVPLINAGADVNEKNNENLTPLHLAAKMSRLFAVEALLLAKACPSLTDDYGKRPIDYAVHPAVKLHLRNIMETHPYKFITEF